MNALRSLLPLFTFLFPLLLTAQNSREVVERYQQSLEKIRSVSYDVRQLDTFVTGHVWDYPGHVTLMKSETDTIFGFHFAASKEGINRGALYDGTRMFDMNFDEKTYELEARVGAHVLGSAAAQLVVPEMMYYQDTVAPELTLGKDEFVLTYRYPDLTEYPVTDRKKVIHLDKHSYLPSKVIKSQVSLGKKQVISRSISQVQINAPDHAAAFDKSLLEEFEPEAPTNYEDQHKDLIDKPVKEFKLETFDGGSVSIQDRQGKVVLMDFWEVWCGPCVQSMPKVQELYEQYSDQGLEVMAVLMDKNSMDSAQTLLDHKGISLPQMIGNEELRSYFKVYAIPQYVLIDREGKIQFIYRGYDEAIETNIRQLLRM